MPFLHPVDPDPTTDECCYRDPAVSTHAEQSERGVRPQQLHRESNETVHNDVDTDGGAFCELSLLLEPQDDGNENESIPQGFVEERRMEGRKLLVTSWPMTGVDDDRPRKICWCAKQLLVEVVSPSSDRLCQRNTDGGSVSECEGVSAAPVSYTHLRAHETDS